MNEPSRSSLPHRRLAILGSGTGTNAESIVRYAQQHDSSGFTVVLIVSTKAEAGIVDVAMQHGIPCVAIQKRGEEFTRSLLGLIDDNHVEMLALAGFMRILDASVIRRLDGAVVNIHPSLLPRYGGKGMYGIHVHEAVLRSHDQITGATVHMVSDQYDEGEIVMQRSIVVEPSDTAASLQDRVKRLEHELYPTAISDHVRKMMIKGNSDQ